MGVADRDYCRQPSCGGGFFDWSPGTAMVCKRLIVANIVVFLLQIFVTRPMISDDLRSRFGDRTERQTETLEDNFDTSGCPRVSLAEQWCQLDTTKVLHGQVWRLLTCAFCHDRLSVWHILFNMLFLWWFGRTLETMYGSREFLLFYLTAAVIASLCFVALQLFTGDRVPCIGASGAVMAVVMLYAIHFPRDKIFIFMLIPIEIRWLVVFYIICDLHPVLLALAGDPVYSGVANAAHLGGLAFGFVYWKRSIRLEPLYDSLRKRRWTRWIGPRRNIRLFKPQEAREDDFDDAEDVNDLDGRLDKILIKIHEHGETSLTTADREVLRIASQRYRQRK
jgi:membrane associated rhomboid family serine protease